MTLKSEVQRNPLIRMFGEDVADFSQLEKLDNPDLKKVREEFLRLHLAVKELVKTDKFLTHHWLKQILLVEQSVRR